MQLESFRFWSLMRKGALFCVVFLGVSLSLEVRTYLAASATRDVALVWSGSPEQDVAGYNVYYGPVSRYEETFDEYLYTQNLRPGDYDVKDPEVHYVLNGIDENISYWVAITAYDHNGNESAYSNEKKIGTPIGTKTSSSNSGGCQTAPVSGSSRSDGRAGAAGWIFLAVVVPAWILLLRKKLPHSHTVS